MLALKAYIVDGPKISQKVIEVDKIEVETSYVLAWCSAVWANLALILRLTVLRSLNGYSSLILAKPCKSKSQLVHVSLCCQHANNFVYFMVDEEHAILLYQRDQKILTEFYNGGL